MSFANEVIIDTPLHWWRFGSTNVVVPNEITTGWDIRDIPSGGSVQSSDLALFPGPTGKGVQVTNSSNLEVAYWRAEGPAGEGLNQLDGLTSFAVEFWIYPVGIDGTHTYQFGIGTSWFGWGFGFNFTILANGSAIAAGYGLDRFEGPTDIPNGTFVSNQWHHVVVTVTDGVYSMYVNKVLIVSRAMAVSPVWGHLYVLMPDAEILEGSSIAELVLYNHPLSAARIAAHYDAGEPPVEPPPPDSGSNYKNLILSDGPLVYYRFNDLESSNRTWDSSGNNYHGTYHGSIQKQQSEI